MTGKPKWTAGSWRVAEGHKNRMIEAIDSDGDRVTIAEVHWWVMEGAAESIANANLLAAALDLYEALGESIVWIHRLCISEDIDPQHIRAGISIDGETLASALTRLRAALSKADGGRG